MQTSTLGCAVFTEMECACSNRYLVKCVHCCAVGSHLEQTFWWAPGICSRATTARYDLPTMSGNCTRVIAFHAITDLYANTWLMWYDKGPVRSGDAWTAFHLIGPRVAKQTILYWIPVGIAGRNVVLPENTVGEKTWYSNWFHPLKQTRPGKYGIEWIR